RHTSLTISYPCAHRAVHQVHHTLPTRLSSDLDRTYAVSDGARASDPARRTIEGDEEPVPGRVDLPPAEAFHLAPDGFLVSFDGPDRKSTRLNYSQGSISYAVFCLKKKYYTYLI